MTSSLRPRRRALRAAASALVALACGSLDARVLAGDGANAARALVWGADAIRVMSFNVRYGTARDGANQWSERRELVAATIDGFAPHLLGVQEALAFQVDYLAERLPHHAVVGQGREGGRSGEFTCLFVDRRRFSVARSGDFWLSTTPEQPGSRGWDAALPRICSWAVLRDRRAGGELVVFNTHFDHRGSRARTESARLVVERLQQHAGLPTLVLGDLNSAEDSQPLRLLRDAGLRDTFRVVEPDAEDVGTSHGFRGRSGGRKIDYVLCDDRHFDVRAAGIDRTRFDGGRFASDHFAVHATLRVVAAASENVPPARASAGGRAADGRIRVMFLGDRGHHQPAARCQQLLPAMAAHGVDLFYTDRLADLNGETLARYDALLIYANHARITPAQEQALLDFVAGGKGLVPIHCASYCFQNSARYVELVGAQFQSHGTGTFRTEITAPEHPVMRGLAPFESWDETYVHHRHNADRTVLEVREEDRRREPWTWVREHGAGRVFYTAWGHDHRTWSHSGFHDLVERGIRWACGDQALRARPDLKPFTFSPATVPQYVPGRGQARLSEMQDPLPPSESRKHLVVPPELDVELFASEPEIRKPICMAWDARGRLWIAETVDYPNELRPEGEGRDRITICEDVDRDGRADRFTVFADELSIPTSLTFARGGVIVTQAPHTLILRDTDGDDRADQREVLFSGWGTGDTHAGPSNLRYGFDNWIWGCVGYSGFRGEVAGERRAFGQGLFRFRADGSAFEFLTSTTNNTWGLAFDEDGFVFGSTANGNPSVHMAIPNRYYETLEGWSPGARQTIAETLDFHPITDAVRQVDWHGKFTAAAGHAVYTARAFPREYWNRAAFVCGPTGHLIGRLFLERQGTHFVARDGWNLLASDDEWTAPIQAEVGPDGAVWVIDWYAYIVQHNPTPRGFRTGKGNAYETPLRDKEHGRVYRIVPRGRRLPEPRDLTAAPNRELVAALRDDNLFWRLTAQRLLVERGARETAPELVELATDPIVDAVGLNVGAVHALWTLHGLGELGADASEAATGAVLAALAHGSAAVRRTALSVVPRTAAARDALLDRGMLGDADPHVRLAALLALSEMPPSPRAGCSVFEMLQLPHDQNDRWIPDAATAAAARHDAGFLQAALAADRGVVSADAAPASGDAPEAPANLLPNPSFEAADRDRPAGWRVRHYSGTADHAWDDAVARSGERSLKITSASGADTSWHATVAVEPESTYELSGWIRTDAVRAKGNAEGALFNVHELQGAERVMTERVRDTAEWKRFSVTFDPRGRTQISINCLFGGWGHATGTAWFDDVRLIRIGGSALPGPVGAVVGRITRHYAARAPRDSVVSTVLALRGASDAIVASFLDGLAAGWPDGTAPDLTDVDRAALGELLESLSPAQRPRLVALADRWGRRDVFSADVETVLGSLRDAVTDSRRSAGDRAAAARRLLALDDRPEVVDAVLASLSLQTDLALSRGLLDALTASRHPATGARVLARWNALTPAARGAAVATLSRRTPWTRDLLRAVEDGRVAFAVISPQRWLQLEQHPDPAIAALAAAAHGRRVDPDREAVVERMLVAAERRGDVSRGMELYATFCSACHRFEGQGGRVGPGLDGIGARPREETLVAILDPNQSVESNYQLWVVRTDGGQVFSGRLDAETRTTIELLDLAGQKHVIPRADIATLEAAPVSLMPATFEALGVEGLADLLEYLCRPNQPGK